MAEDLTCPICTTTFLDPVVTKPCVHTFCGSCLQTWTKEHNSCPSCRATLTAAMPDKKTAALLALTPGTPCRTPEDVTAAREVYAPDCAIHIASPLPPPSLELVDHALMHFSACPCCDPNNSTGYVCPQPIERDIVSDAEVESGHSHCHCCLRTVPAGWRAYRCTMCTQQSCRTMFECPTALQGAHAPDFMLPPGEQTLQEHDRERFARSLRLQFLNDTEWRIFEQWLNNGNGVGRVLDSMKEWMQAGHAPEIGEENNDAVCQCCIRDYYEQTFKHWWIDFKNSSSEAVDFRPRCAYGTQCQSRSSVHAQAYNHAHPTMEFEVEAGMVSPSLSGDFARSGEAFARSMEASARSIEASVRLFTDAVARMEQMAGGARVQRA